MTDVDRYLSLIGRQKKKLQHAEAIVPQLSDVRLDIGPGQSLNQIAKALTEQGISPQPNRPGKKWTAQQVYELVYFDGLEPTDENLWQRLPNAKLGFRVIAQRTFNYNRADIARLYGEERLRWEEDRLKKHLDDISRVAKAVRHALGVK